LMDFLPRLDGSRREQEIERPTSLLSHVNLLDEVFPATDMPAGLVEIPSDTIVPLPEENRGRKRRRALSGNQEAFDVGDCTHQQESFPSFLSALLRDAPRKHPRLMDVGHVRGFDLDTTFEYSDFVVEANNREKGDPHWRRPDQIDAKAAFMPPQLTDHCCGLRALLSSPGEMIRPVDADTGTTLLLKLMAAQQDGPVDVSLQRAFPAPSLPAPPLEWGTQEQPSDDFSDSGALIANTDSASVELASAFTVPASDVHQTRKRKGAQALHYDAQTAQVGTVLRKYAEANAGAGRRLTIDDLLPAAATESAIAAKTFHALLTLATAGEFVIEQKKPYSAIAFSLGI